MSATETTLRRSTRERTHSKAFVSLSGQKRKRAESSGDERDEDVDNSENGGSSDDGPEGASDGDEAEYPDPRPRPPKKVTAKITVAPSASNGRTRKRPRVGETTRRRKHPTFYAVAAVKDASISDDNALFNALLNPATALESTVQDFLDSYNATPEAACADLINCVFRLCGCNASVDSDIVMDSDGVVDFLGDVVEEIKGTDTQGYPLVSKAPVFRKLRKSLSEFFDRLVRAASEADTLFSSDVIPTLQSWVVAMSSAQLRSFRHTATIVALEVESALCTVAADIEKAAETIHRQKEAERKKRKGAGVSEREKTLSSKAAEAKGRKTKMNELLNDFFDGVFVHRYRDADSGIRADCVREMGIWMKRHPAHFLEGTYLRYVGWVLSDTHTTVRLEAVKSLQSLYAKSDYLITIQHFTERFKPRLISIATSDADLSVRVAVIHVLRAIDSAGLLDEDQRSTLCLLIFDDEARVRKAISAFVKGIWEETLKERLVGRDEEDDSPVVRLSGIKALASLLVAWDRTLEKHSEDSESLSNQDGENERGTQLQPVTTSNSMPKGRTSLAVEALWDEINAVRDWQTLLDILILDHSSRASPEKGDRAEGLSSPYKMRGKKGKGANKTKARGGQNASGVNGTDDDVVDEAWRLEDDEERALVDVLITCLQKVLADEATKKTGDLDSVQVDTTRALIKALPKLFTKHQTDTSRMTELLKLPQLMRLDLYLEMRMMTAYESLWDDVMKQILTQTSPSLLGIGISTISYMLSTATLSNTNNAKSLELDDELAASLREAVAGYTELDAATFSSDEIDALTAVLMRLTKMTERRDMSVWMEEDEGGKRSSAWDVVCALMERGRLGRKEEEKFVIHAITSLSLHVVWKAAKLRNMASVTSNLDDVDLLRKQRDYLLEQLADFVAGGQFNTTNSVKRTAFQSLVTLHILFARDPLSPEAPSALSSLILSMDERLQHQCAGFIQAEAELYAEELHEHHAIDDGSRKDSPLSEQEGSGDDETPVKATWSKRSKQKNAVINGDNNTIQPRRKVTAELFSEYDFIAVVSYFLRAINSSAISVRHSAVLLAYHGRLGTQFDHCLSPVIGVLREEGMYKKNGALVEQVINEALRQSFTMFTDGQTDSVAASVSLAKALSPIFVIRGAQLSIVQRLPSQHVVELHSSLLSWILKRIAGYDASGNKKKKADSIEFFRVLHALLVTIDSNEASQIKAHLDKALEQTKLEVPATAKAWDAERLYDKRLLGAMAKDKAIVAKRRAGAAKTKTNAVDGTETDATSDRRAVTTKRTPKAPKTKSRPTRQSARTTKPINPLASDSEPLTDLDTDHNDGPEGSMSKNAAQNDTSMIPDSSVNSKPRPKPRFEPKEHGAQDNQEAESVGIPVPTLPRPGLDMGTGGRRALPLSDDESMEDVRDEGRAQGEGNAADNDEDMEDGSSLSSPPPTSRALTPLRQKRQPSPAASDASLADFTTSRKRVRR